MQKTVYHDIFMLLALELAQRSSCVKKKVGAIITREAQIVAMGYNGPPANSYRCDELYPTTGCKRSLRGGCALSIHAEQNAILDALFRGIYLKNCILYVTLAPCLPCARMIFGAGIQKIIYRESYAAYKNLSMEEGIYFLHTFGITAEQYDPWDQRK